MIKTLEVDGFKSLKDFKIEFTKGLNVLVGPNGVGKTNICQALSILSALSNNDLYDAFTQYGGVQSTFNTVECDSDNKKIKISASGETKGNFEQKLYELRYVYSIQLTLNDELEFAKESLTIKRKTNKNTYRTIIKVNQNSKNEVKAEITDSDLIGHFQMIKKGERTFKINLQSQESFLPLMSRLFFSCHLIFKEFSKIKSFNIDPHIARKSCDITEPHEMLGNGRYLANTIYFLNKKGHDVSEINSLLKQLLPNYNQLKPETSEISLKRFFTIEDENGHEFPSNSLSDGTIKLMALLVGIVSQHEKTTIIEEPENYLHPYANRLLIDYLRETYDDGICILTSHSETILNLIKPEELIICELEGSFTNSSRIANIQQVKKVIENSGFGCGYHYLAGNLGGVPKY